MCFLSDPQYSGAPAPGQGGQILPGGGAINPFNPGSAAGQAFSGVGQFNIFNPDSAVGKAANDVAKNLGTGLQAIANDPRKLAAVGIMVAYPGAAAAIGNTLLPASIAASYPTMAAIVGQTALNAATNGGDVKAAVTNALISQGAPQLTKYIADSYATEGISKAVTDWAAKATVDSTIASAMGKDPTSALLFSGAKAATDAVLDKFEIKNSLSMLPKEAASALKAAITAKVMNIDPSQAIAQDLINGAIQSAQGMVKAQNYAKYNKLDTLTEEQLSKISPDTVSDANGIKNFVEDANAQNDGWKDNYEKVLASEQGIKNPQEYRAVENIASGEIGPNVKGSLYSDGRYQPYDEDKPRMPTAEEAKTIKSFFERSDRDVPKNVLDALPTEEKDIDEKIVQKDEPVAKPAVEEPVTSPVEKFEADEPTVGDVPNDSGTKLQKAVDLGKSGDMLGQINMMREIVELPPFNSMDEYNADQRARGKEEVIEPTKDEALPPKTEPGLPSVLPAEPEIKTTLYTKEDMERDEQAEQARRVADFGKDLTGGGNQNLGDVDTKTGFYDPDASGLGAYKYDAQSGTYTYTSDDGSTLTVDGEGKIVGSTPATDSKPPAVEATKPPATKTPQTTPPKPDTGLPSIVPAVIGTGIVGAVVGSNTGTTTTPAVPAAGSNVTLNWNQQEIKKPENGIAYGQKFFDPVFSAAGGGLMALATGGMTGKFTTLGSYSDGGRLLRGPGDGMSDNIPATIANRQPARLADGEFVVPADVVSHLGNGSTDAGAKVLYAMMDRVRKARTGKAKQGKKIMPQKFVPN
jgi:hypothetical protein